MAQTIGTLAGRVSGRTNGDITAFLGIPYAATPVGKNRWRAPQPVGTWRGVRDATSYCSDCAQAPFPPNVLPGIQTKPSEDCLYLNVWKPSGTGPNAKLPVMMWIHGGGFVNGGSSCPVYSGTNFARDGVIFVNFNYRLGRFGFFAHPALVDEGFGGNFGFLDQIAALEWVRDNIASFGGDPARVTVFGESAGGMSMHMLLQSPLARGLFHGVIIQSGGGRVNVMPMLELASAAGAGQNFAPVRSSEALRAIPAEKVSGDLSMLKMDLSSYSGPMLDGRTILGSPLEGAANGLYADVPIIIGANSADALTVTQDKNEIFAAAGNHADEARALYDPHGSETGLRVAVLVSSDRLFKEPARAVARALAAQGRKVWLYRFAHNGTQSGVDMGGAPHASEIPYVFDLADLRLQQLDTGHDAEVAALTHRYWVNFAKTGRPDSDGGVPAWPHAAADTTKIQLIGTEETAHVEDPRTAALDFRERLAKAR